MLKLIRERYNPMPATGLFLWCGCWRLIRVWR